MYSERKCKITFICHGATIYSEEGRISDNENYPPLNDAGQEEIEKMCNFIRGRGIKNDKIYASPGTRTIQSVEMIAKVYKQDFDIIEDLHPRKLGKLSGFTLEQLSAKYPVLFNEIYEPSNKVLDIPEGVETAATFINRIKKTLNTIIEDNIGSRIIIVTHPEIIKAAICLTLKVPAKYIHRIQIKTASATQISYFENCSTLLYVGVLPT